MLPSKSSVPTAMSSAVYDMEKPPIANTDTGGECRRKCAAQRSISAGRIHSARGCEIYGAPAESQIPWGVGDVAQQKFRTHGDELGSI